MKLTREEFKEKLLELFGEEPTDEQLAVIEDYVDTFEDEEDESGWKEKYEQLDKSWRKKYRDRFLGKENPKKEDEEDEEDEEKTKYEELFEEKKEE